MSQSLIFFLSNCLRVEVRDFFMSPLTFVCLFMNGALFSLCSKRLSNKECAVLENAGGARNRAHSKYTQEPATWIFISGLHFSWPALTF